MLGITKIRGPLIMAIFPLKKFDFHTNSADDSVETPMERIKKIFISTEIHPLSKELRTLKHYVEAASFVGMIVGGLRNTQGAVQQFIDNNQATRFYGHYDAQREAQFAFTLKFLKGSFKFGWRAGLFTTIFGSIQLLLTAYYGEHSVWHYVVGGATGGLLFKMSLGIKGSLSGLIVGSFLGTVAGSINMLLLKLTGLELEDLQKQRQEWAYAQDLKFKEAISQTNAYEFKEGKILYDENKAIKAKLSNKENLPKEEQLSKEEKGSEKEKAKN